MEKEENQSTTTKNHQEPEKETAIAEENLDDKINQDEDKKVKEEIKELSPEEKITELEDKLVRTFAEMENQRRRFEKEKEEAFEYGGYSFAKEALNLIDNLERSKQILETDEKLKDTEALKKSLEHLDIIQKDTISIPSIILSMSLLFFKLSSLLNELIARSTLSNKDRDSFAKLNPPNSKASCLSFSNLLL